MICQCKNKSHTQGCSIEQFENTVLCIWCTKGCFSRGED